MTIEALLYQPGIGLSELADLPKLSEIPKDSVIWLDSELTNQKNLEEIALKYGLHELAIEDALTSDHLPKFEDFGRYFFMIFRSLHIASNDTQEEQINIFTPDEDEKNSRSLAIFLGPNFLITHRTKEIAWLDALKRQVKQVPEMTLAKGTDELAHKVIDVLIDRFYRGLNHFEGKVDELEDKVISSPEDFELSNVLDLKRELGSLRQTTRDQKAIISRLASETNLIKEKQLRRYFKDIDDHALATLKNIDKQIESLVGIRDVYFALSNVRLGDIMRILAVITTIAVPLNLVVGLYGMNFDAIPLLHTPYGFWMIMFLMILLALIMLVFFRRNKWI